MYQWVLIWSKWWTYEAGVKYIHTKTMLVTENTQQSSQWSANERRPHYRTVVLVSVAGSHSTLVLIMWLISIPNVVDNLKKKSKCDQDLLHGCIIRATEMLNKATQLLTFLVDKSLLVAVLGFLRTKKFHLTSIVRMQTLLWFFMGLSILHSLCRHKLSTYFIKLIISNQGFSMYISIYNYEVK